MAWTDITKEFYEEFGDYFVCAKWNGKNGGGFSATFLTDQKALLRGYSLYAICPDKARFFLDPGSAQEALDHENELRPGITDGFQVLRLNEIEAAFGHAPHPSTALVGGPGPRHPVQPQPIAAAPSP